MNVQQFYYFEAISRLKSYTKAAEELLTTQSCLSHSIHDLEKELSISLFTYNGKFLELTPFGELFYSHIKKILGELKLIEIDREELSTMSKETVRVSFTANMGYEWIPLLIQSFKAIPENENILFSFSETTATKDSFDLLRANQIDVVFGARILDPNVDSYYILSEELFAVVPNDSPYAKQETFNLESLSRNTLITYNKNCGTRHYIDEILSDYNVKPAKLMETATEKMMVSAVSAKLGITIVPSFPEMSHYNVTALPIQASTHSRPLHMMWLKEKYDEPTIRRFISFAKTFASASLPTPAKLTFMVLFTIMLIRR